jgi:hypothetical protein
MGDGDAQALALLDGGLTEVSQLLSADITTETGEYLQTALKHERPALLWAIIGRPGAAPTDKDTAAASGEVADMADTVGCVHKLGLRELPVSGEGLA